MIASVQKPLLKSLICLGLVAITFAAFAGVVHCSFISMDDRVYVVANPQVAHGFSWSSVKWALETFHAGYWIPVTWFSHMLDCQIYGLGPAGHHVTNLIFHVANTVLLFLLLQRLTARLWPSSFVALIFGIHPMHVESVAWVAERKDVLSTFFFLLTLLAYARYAELTLPRAGPKNRQISECGFRNADLPSPHPDPLPSHPTRLRSEATARRVGAERERQSGANGSPKVGRLQLYYTLAVIFCILGLMSKPMIVTLPFVLLLLDFWPLIRFPLWRGGTGHQSETPHVVSYGRILIEKLPFFLLAGVFSYITFLTQRSAGAVKPVLEYSLADRLGHVPISYAWYLLKFFWPANLSVFYTLHKGMETPLEVAAAVLLLLAVTVFALGLARKYPYFLFGWLWFLGMLLPVIGLVQSGGQAYADRFAYLPYIGLFIIVAWGVSDLAGTARCAVTARKPGGTFSAGRPTALVAPLDTARTAVAAPLAKRTVPTMLFATAALVTVACFVRTIQEVGYWKNGILLCQRAIALDPKNGYAWMALGVENSNRKDFDEAINCMSRATALDPKLDLAWHYLGKLLAQKGKYNDAENAFQNALENTWFNGNRIEIYNDLGDSLASAGTYQQAIAAYQNSLDLNPNQPDTQTKLGQAFLQNQQLDQAAPAFQAALSLQPGNPDALIGLGMISESSGVASAAVADYREALQAEPDSVLALNNLAWLLATDSDPALRDGPDAVDLAERACQLTHYERAYLVGTLAAAYAEAGRFDDAVAAAQKAHDVALADGEKHLADRNAQLLQLYKSHQPYRESLKR